MSGTSAVVRMHGPMTGSLPTLMLFGPVVREGATHVFHLYVVLTEDRERVRAALAERGVATGIHYPIPIHQQVAWKGMGRVVGDLAVTESQADRILSLPMYAELTPEQIAHVVTCLREAWRTDERQR